MLKYTKEEIRRYEATERIKGYLNIPTSSLVPHRTVRLKNRLIDYKLFKVHPLKWIDDLAHLWYLSKEKNNYQSDDSNKIVYKESRLTIDERKYRESTAARDKVKLFRLTNAYTLISTLCLVYILPSYLLQQITRMVLQFKFKGN